MLSSGGGTYTTLDGPLATGAVANGINNAGQIVGYYQDSSSFKTRGFLYSGGIYTTLDDPLATMGTFPQGINDAGQIVGYYKDSSFKNHGFLYSGGIYTTLDAPFASQGFDQGTQAYDINDAGQIVGYYRDSQMQYHGFLFNPGGGTYTTLDDPSALLTYAIGINDAGQIVGRYDESNGHTHGFSFIRVLTNPPPPVDTSADMILRSTDGRYEIYNLGQGTLAFLAGFELGQVGADWKFAGLGSFFWQRHHRHDLAKRYRWRARTLRH
jgi:probable HAF family extracellular repeat protein